VPEAILQIPCNTSLTSLLKRVKEKLNDMKTLALSAVIRNLWLRSFAVLAFVHWTTLQVNSAPPPSMPPEVLSAAQSGLSAFLDRIPRDEMEPYGFPKGSDLSQARLGEPFLLYQITPASLRHQRAGQSVRALISPTTRWHFPVILDTGARALLVIDQDKEGWKAVSLGYASLAGALNHIRKQWPASKGYHPQFVAMFPAKQFFFSIPEHDDHNLTPIPSAPQTPGNSEGQSPKSTYSTANTALGRVEEVVKHLRGFIQTRE
jgi:hypothetical protein